MNDRMARGIFPILRQGLIDRDRIATRRPPARDKVQADLKQKLQFGDRPDGDYLGARYALACWLDDIFLSYNSPWSQWWNENKLEHHLFQTNDRGWKFWEQARMAAARGDKDTIELYYLAMLLGFRGELDGKYNDLADWRDLFETEIGLKYAEDWPDMPNRLREPTGDRPRPLVREQLRWLFLGIAGVFCIILFVAFFLVVSLGRGG